LNTLYFAYADFLDPDRLLAVAPNAEFRFIAHFPETRLAFVDSDRDSGLPTLLAESGHTVWGGVFEIPDSDVGALTEAEESEGRVADWDTKAVDREGNKYECLTFVSKTTPDGDHRPGSAHLAAMIRGAKHWSLPAGWVLGLEDLADPLF
jgi:AIG2-like family